MLGPTWRDALRSIDPIRRRGMSAARELRRWERLERIAKAGSGRDIELGKRSVEVTAHRPMRQEQPFRDLLVRQARCREGDDLEFLWREPGKDVFTRMP